VLIDVIFKSRFKDQNRAFKSFLFIIGSFNPKVGRNVLWFKDIAQG
jgi:hypothetical protein